MSNEFRAKPSDLLKVWSLSGDLEQKQLTLRIQADVFYKIQALEAMFPGRSRNGIISDLLATAIDELVESLTSQETDEIIGFVPIDDANQYDPEAMTSEPIYKTVGSLSDFWRFFNDAKSKGSDKKVEEIREVAA